MSANPAAPKQPAPASDNANETALELGGGGLAILALGAAAVAIANRRRGRRDEEAWNYDNLEPAAESEAERQEIVAEHEPPMIAPEPSAFAWGNSQVREQQATAASGDRYPGETWVERAYRGPTADNPSLSLRKRLKRAAFFDKREREAAQGKAEPVEADAGLPDNVVEQRELEAA
jgi:hypothetical protein